MPLSITERPEALTDGVNRLRKNAVGLVSVIFMAVATAAPITAMTGNVPSAVGFGNGLGVPAGYLVATVVLAVFSVGYAAMAKHITSTGAFYGYISYGLGQIVGMVGRTPGDHGVRVFEASLIGIFAYFGQQNLKSLTGVDIHWCAFAACSPGSQRGPTYFDINLAAKVLGVFLVTEIVMLAADGRSVALFHGGGPDGFIARAGQPGQRVPDHRADGRCRRSRPVLRLLVVGRLRVHRDVRRGVPQPQEDHPARRR